MKQKMSFEPILVLIQLAGEEHIDKSNKSSQPEGKRKEEGKEQRVLWREECSDYIVLKSDNLQYNTVGQWVEGTVFMRHLIIGFYPTCWGRTY